MIDFIRIFEDYHIPHRQGQRGFIEVPCPWCGDNSDWHGGFHQGRHIFNCWKCSRKPISTTLQALTGVPWTELRSKYQGDNTEPYIEQTERFEAPTELILPDSTITELKKEHWDYLKRRGFDPDKLVKTWGLKATSHIGKYNFRIFIPVFFNGVMISYLARDWTNKAETRYLSCDKRKELIHNKHILYGIDLIRGRTGVIVEGCTDSWRLGPGAVATMGTGYTQQQVLFIWERFDKVFIMFDSEDKAQERALKLGFELSGMGVETERIRLINGDPGSLKQKDADSLMKELIP